MRKFLRGRLVVGVGGAAVLISATVALGHVGPVEPEVIHACVTNQGGTIRIIAADGTCRPSETPLDWNAQAATPEPAFVTVDCASGETVGQALADTAAAPFVEITVAGTCTESVSIERDDVVLQAAPEGGTLAAPSPDVPVVVMHGQRHIGISGLTLSGGEVGLAAGAQFHAAEVHITGASTGVRLGGGASAFLEDVTIDGCAERGIAAGGNASVGVSGGSITGCGTGVQAETGAIVEANGLAIADTTGAGVVAQEGGVVALRNGSTISNAGHFGAFAFGGTITVSGADSFITGSTFSGLNASDGGEAWLQFGARVFGNSDGVSANNGGSLLIQDGAIVEDNVGGGVSMSGSSSLRMRGSVIVRGNGGHGVLVRHTSVAEFGDSTNQIVDNAGWGILCFPEGVALMAGDPGTVSGNAAGEINCTNA